MPSNFYCQVRDTLPDDHKAALDDFIRWLASDTGIALPWHKVGQRLADNLTAEAHLVGDADYGDQSEMFAFLMACAASFKIASSDDDRRTAFNAVCKDFVLKGLSINAVVLQNSLVRYGSAYHMSIALRRMVGDRSADDFDKGLTSAVVAEQILAKEWAATKFLAGDRLALGRVTFATPLNKDFASSSDALYVAESLALPVAFPQGKSKTRHMVQMIYPTDKVRNHRFPTIADAGNFPGFLPAPEIAPTVSNPNSCVGWTCPIGSGVPQPEIVHDNESLQILQAPLKLIGSFDR